MYCVFRYFGRYSDSIVIISGSRATGAQSKVLSSHKMAVHNYVHEFVKCVTADKLIVYQKKIKFDEI